MEKVQLIDRQAVEGTDPTVYIGHRVYRHRDGKVSACRPWYAQFADEGRQRYVALKTRYKCTAIRLAHKLVDELRRGEPICAPRPKVRMSELRDRYIQYQLNQERSPKTLEKYRLTLKRFVRWCTAKGITDAPTFNEEDFWAFNKSMTDAGLSRKTRYDRLIIVKQLFRWAKRLEILSRNLISGAQLKPPPATQQPCFSPNQVGALLQAASGDEELAFSLMAYAGLRFGEVRELRWSDVMLDEGRGGIILVQRGGARDSTKNQRSRRIPMNPALRQLLLRHPRADVRVVTVHGKPIEERPLLMRLKALCQTCGFDRPEQYKLHTFRHAFASQCARSSVAYRYALSWLGHSSSEILDLYYHMFDDSAAEAMKTVTYPGQAGRAAPEADWQI